MSRKIYPYPECNDCKHVIDIESDILGRDVITCECDECDFEECKWVEDKEDHDKMAM